jgi:hypothetical protein
LVTGVFLLLFIFAFAGEMALHQWSKVLNVIGIYIVFMVAATWVILRVRNRYDYYIEVDGESLRRWSPTGEVSVRRDELVGIEWRPDEFVIEAKTGTITITKAYIGFNSLRRLAEQWERERRNNVRQ